MAVEHIPIESTINSAQLRRWVEALRIAVTEGPLIKSKMDTMVDTGAEPDDYSHLETQYGAPGGTGFDLWSDVARVVQALEANPDSELATAGNAAQLRDKLRQLIDRVG